MFDSASLEFLEFRDDEPPKLIVTIDTEAEFEWQTPFSRSKTRVNSVSEQHRAHEFFDRLGIVPTYLVDFAVAANEAAVRTLREFHETGRCEIGSHLNPWINPPYDETVKAFHSYPCNLPAGLERKKLEQLTHTIGRHFDAVPKVYRAGRYGIGSSTPKILEDLGYCVDMSVVPFTSFASDGGPDFQGFDYRPYRFGTTKRLLGIPVSCGFAGWLAGAGQSIFPVLSSRGGMRLHLPGLLAQLRAIERIRLTPEGVGYVELRRLTESLLGLGCRVFSFTYHSPSLVPGNTPYVRDNRELQDFLRTVERYCNYFVNELNGKTTTPMELYGLLNKAG